MGADHKVVRQIHYVCQASDLHVFAIYIQFMQLDIQQIADVIRSFSIGGVVRVSSAQLSSAGQRHIIALLSLDYLHLASSFERGHLWSSGFLKVELRA